MTVAELIAELQKLDPSLPVIIEGCDCANPAKDVECHADYMPDHSACAYITAILY